MLISPLKKVDRTGSLALKILVGPKCQVAIKRADAAMTTSHYGVWLVTKTECAVFCGAKHLLTPLRPKAIQTHAPLHAVVAMEHTAIIPLVALS